ncbi:MAG: hypothetical protein AAFN16_11230 [Pseudomonadota bacterium]
MIIDTERPGSDARPFLLAKNRKLTDDVRKQQSGSAPWFDSRFGPRAPHKIGFFSIFAKNFHKLRERSVFTRFNSEILNSNMSDLRSARIPVDMFLLKSTHLQFDENLLTSPNSI